MKFFPSKYSVYFLIFSAFLAGCASGYTLSSDALSYRSSLSDASAFETIAQLSKRTNQQNGVCSAVTNRPGYLPANFISVENSLLTVSSAHGVIAGVNATINNATNTVSTSISDAFVADIVHLDLRKLNKIRVLAAIKGYACEIDSDTPLQGYLVMIDNRGMGSVSDARPNAVVINVSAQNVDRLLAALTHLSPQGKLISGTGF